MYGVKDKGTKDGVGTGHHDIRLIYTAQACRRGTSRKQMQKNGSKRQELNPNP